MGDWRWLAKMLRHLREWHSLNKILGMRLAALGCAVLRWGSFVLGMRRRAWLAFLRLMMQNLQYEAHNALACDFPTRYQ